MIELTALSRRFLFRTARPSNNALTRRRRCASGDVRRTWSELDERVRRLAAGCVPRIAWVTGSPCWTSTTCPARSCRWPARGSARRTCRTSGSRRRRSLT
ncbi:hypothetical protein HBB16_13065 [Pseudonocardia sp. MCCB 268]|nr:hypothetical protein [Pseudonocardia cytotoxica]